MRDIHIWMMKYNILDSRDDIGLIDRLLGVRGVDLDNADSFLDPKYTNSRISGWRLSDMTLAVNRIMQAISAGEKIMIFGDYDVDGVTSSWLLYKFFHKFLNYKNISIRLPNRLEDGYGIKNYHIDQIAELGVSLIITVDCGISAIAECQHAIDIGVDMIVTDHHQALDTLPSAVAVINPQVSPDYPFKGLCGAAVAFKLACCISEHISMPKNKTQQFLDYFLPIVAIATVSDCMELLGENRLLVKKGLEAINLGYNIPSSLLGFIEYLGLSNKIINSTDIGFVIGPRLNASGRILSPTESLKVLLYTGDKQKEFLDNLEQLNIERKQIQNEVYKIAESQILSDLGDKHMLIAGGEDFHEGIVGVVAGKLTEKYFKPSLVYKIDIEKGVAIGSLRGPSYFSVIDMLHSCADILDRYGGHQQAGGITVSIDMLDRLTDRLYTYTQDHISEYHDNTPPVKTIDIDTILHHHELELDILRNITTLEPFGNGNNEPTMIIQDVIISSVHKIGKNGNGHIKFLLNCSDRIVEAIFWGKGVRIDEFKELVGSQVSIVHKIRIDSFSSQGFYLNVVDILV